jgi:hypothetical protein
MNLPADAKPQSETVRPGIGFFAVLAGLAVAGTTSLLFVLQAAWADASSLRARNTVISWREGTGSKVTDERWQHTLSQLQGALDTAPGNAQLHDDMAYLYASRSQGMGTLPLDTPEYQLQQDLMDQAIANYRTACALRPTFPYTWVNLALAKHARGHHDAEFLAAYDRAMQFGHTEADLHIFLANLTYSQWSRLGPQRQQTFANLAASAKAKSRIMFRNLADRAGVQLPPAQ